VAPVYEPEVAAEAIVRAAQDGRRAEIVGAWNTAVVGINQLAPGVVAHFAARTAVDGQQTDVEETDGRPSNLWHPVDDDRDAGSHGTFTDTSGVRSPAFLRTLPGTGVALGRAVVDQLVESVRALAHAR
jgi:hypothetical protein